MPTYEHLCTKCQHEWEDFYSIKKDPPKTCPKCNKTGYVKRLISGGAGKGIVTLYGSELKEYLNNDAKNIIKEAYTNENLLANVVGENKYHQNELKRIKK